VWTCSASKGLRVQSPLAIIEWDASHADGVVCTWNKAAEQLFCSTFTEVEVKTLQFLAPEELDLKLSQLTSDFKARTSSETLIAKNLSLVRQKRRRQTSLYSHLSGLKSEQATREKTPQPPKNGNSG